MRKMQKLCLFMMSKPILCTEKINLLKENVSDVIKFFFI